MNYIPRKIQFTPAEMIKLLEYLEKTYDAENYPEGFEKLERTLHVTNVFEIYEDEVHIDDHATPGVYGIKTEVREGFWVPYYGGGGATGVRVDAFRRFLQQTGFINGKQYRVT